MQDYDQWQADRRDQIDRLVRWARLMLPITLMFAAAATLSLLLTVLVGEADGEYGSVATVCMIGSLVGAVLLSVIQGEKQHLERLLIDERHHREAGGID